MIYKPSVGRFKDGFIIWHECKFYHFSMYSAIGQEDFRNVWLATSLDGVHWEDAGAVISDAPFNIWAMAVHKIGDRFIMNHGSFTRPGIQNVIRFWESRDLINWKFMGYDLDLTPDTRWYHPDSRLDCMSVVPVIKNDATYYYGYATGPGGFLESDDSIHWSGMPQPEIDWDTAVPPPIPEDEGGFEIGGCHRINGRYYLVGGWFNYMGSTGYGVYTLVADNPQGPFKADIPAFRLCGNSKRWVAMWARFCQTDTDLLVNGYMYSGYSYETGDTWLPPIKKAVIDSNNHLHLRYWEENNLLKGNPLAIDYSCIKIAYSDNKDSCSLNINNERLEIQAQPERNSIIRRDIPTTVTVMDRSLNSEKGFLMEGSITAACFDRRLTASSAGIYLEEVCGEGTAIILHGYGMSQIGKLTLSNGFDFDIEDETGPGCAAPAGIIPHIPHTFRLIVRMNMFEFYLDDMLIQTFNTTHEPGKPGIVPHKIGFIAQNGNVVIENLKVWEMNLD